MKTSRWDEVMPETQPEAELLTGVTSRTQRETIRVDADKAQETAAIRAALLVCLLGDQHNCSLPVPCTDPNHRRDIHLMKTQIRDVLGLDPAASRVSDADRKNLLAAAKTMKVSLDLDEPDAA